MVTDAKMLFRTGAAIAREFNDAFLYGQWQDTTPSGIVELFCSYCGSAHDHEHCPNCGAPKEARVTHGA